MSMGEWRPTTCFGYSNMKSLCLPRFSVGKDQLRFIYYSRSRGKCSLSQTDCTEDDDVLLFLGADVVSSCHNNNIHSRYWNMGLAVKICFEDAIVEGITNSKSLWFYTVEGVFHCAFTYLDKIQQKDIVTNLLDHWLKTDKIKDDKLPKTICATGDSFENIGKPSNHQMNLSSCGNSGATSSSNSIQSAASETHVILHMLDSIEAIEDSTTKQTELATDVTPESLFSSGGNEHKMDETSELGRTLATISSTHQSLHDDAQRQILEQALLLTCRYFQLLDCTRDLFPFNLLQTYIDLVTANTTGGFHAHQGDLMLYVVSSWLGNEFLRLKTCVQDQVTKFKLEHIQCINSLPSPKLLVNELFPACMAELLERWMGAQTKKIQQEHNYMKHSVHQLNQYPIIQLILELANDTLISGMSHAVYAQMMQTS